MNFKNTMMAFLGFDNTYKVFMLLSLSGSKLNGGVLEGSNTPVDCFRP